MRTIKTYLNDVQKMILAGDAREESYYSLLERLIFKMRKTNKYGPPRIVIMPKGTDAGNPDFVIKRSNDRIIGYIEAKAPNKNLDKAVETEQLKRYLDVFPNLILTNFQEFRLYHMGTLIRTVSITSGTDLGKPAVVNSVEFKKLLQDFFSYAPSGHADVFWLARKLAKLTRFMKDFIVMEELQKVEPEPAGGNHIHALYAAFKRYLIHGLNKSQFADLYCQTLTFGIFTAASLRKGKINKSMVSQAIPPGNGILRDIFQFLSMGDLTPQLECCIENIMDLLTQVPVEKALHLYYIEEWGGDPVLHFYETFLACYDPALREKKGVYYTPVGVVSFIVRSIHLVLKEKLNRADGLADRSVKVLDPASGTATFADQVIRQAEEEFFETYGEGAVPELLHDYMLNNIYCFEELMASYAMGHLRMLYTLKKKVAGIDKMPRFNLYLTNTLDMENIEQSDLPGMHSLSRESRLAGKIKKKTPITVILGNPPYAGHSCNNNSEWIVKLMDTYKRIGDQPLQEKNLKWLQDDYVKFIRFAQHMIDNNGLDEGVIGFITNHGYLDNPTFRGMRYSLMQSFNQIYILDLHGNQMKREKAPDGSADENIFDIRQGVAIAIFIKMKTPPPNVGTDARPGCRVFHAEMWGKRKDKYKRLIDNTLNTIEWQEIYPEPSFYLFTPVQRMDSHRYAGFFKVTDIFPVHSVGIVTARDKLTIHKSKEEVYKTVSEFLQTPESEIPDRYNLPRDTRDWQVAHAQKDLRESGPHPGHITSILYRPFDCRYTYYTGRSRGFLCMPRPEVMRHMLQENIGLITVRQVAEGIFNHSLVTDTIAESRITTSNKGIGYLFPLYIYTFSRSQVLRSRSGKSANKKSHLFSGVENDDMSQRQANINPDILRMFDHQPGFDQPPTPEHIFYYIYGVLFSPLYRKTYAQGLKIDFPRIPFTRDAGIFFELARLGQQLVSYHLMTSEQFNHTVSKFQVKGSNIIRDIRYFSQQNQLFINKNQYFTDISPHMWNYKLAGYQVMKKWLTSRRGERLNGDEILHYINIARSIELTMKIQKKIDLLYPTLERNLFNN